MFPEQNALLHLQTLGAFLLVPSVLYQGLHVWLEERMNHR